jgi:hypothetical protein
MRSRVEGEVQVWGWNKDGSGVRYRTRQDKTRQDKTRQGKAGQDMRCRTRCRNERPALALGSAWALALASEEESRVRAGSTLGYGCRVTV